MESRYAERNCSRGLPHSATEEDALSSDLTSQLCVPMLIRDTYFQLFHNQKSRLIHIVSGKSCVYGGFHPAGRAVYEFAMSAGVSKIQISQAEVMLRLWERARVVSDQHSRGRRSEALCWHSVPQKWGQPGMTAFGSRERVPPHQMIYGISSGYELVKLVVGTF